MSDFQVLVLVVVVMAALALLRRSRIGPIPVGPKDSSPTLSRAASRHARYRLLFSATCGLVGVSSLNANAGDGRISGESVAVQAALLIVAAFAYFKMRRYQREAQREAELSA